MATKQTRRGPRDFTPAPYVLAEAAASLPWGTVNRGRGSYYLDALKSLQAAPAGKALRFEGELKRIAVQLRKWAKKLGLEIELAEQDKYVWVRERSSPLQTELLKAIMFAPRTMAELGDAVKAKLPTVTSNEVKLVLDQLAARGKAHRRDDMKWRPGGGQ